MNATALIAHYKDTALVSDDSKLYFEKVASELGGFVEFMPESPGFWIWAGITLPPDISYWRGPKKQRRQPTQSVYFIRAATLGLIKIGVAGGVSSRLAALQNMSPDRLEVVACEGGGKQRERELHAIFSDARAHGEWFYPTDDLIFYINRLRESGGIDHD